MRSALLVVALGVAAGCNALTPLEPSCNAPENITYSCAPSPPGSPGCVGGPTWTTRSGETRHENPDQVFAVGCSVQLTECSPYYPDSPRTQSCDPGFVTSDAGTAMPFWVEPL